ncbi:hypothetical protein [Halomonas mongoliensis]|uniref:hypothetical protein n=1 Tax=Halomonas mongoliensis TaxID=321265 RepID=UPI00403B17F7
MRATARDLCNLYVRGNWGFSSTLTKMRGFGKHSPPLEKQKRVPGIDTGCFNDSVIAVNSTFLEVVDSGNRLRGVNSFFALMAALPVIVGFAFLGYGLLVKSEHMPVFVYFFSLAAALLILLVGFPLFSMCRVPCD